MVDCAGHLRLRGHRRQGARRRHAITGTPYFVAHVALGDGKSGAHVLEGSKPVGIQVIGYGDNTSYMYPGGLNLALIAPPPLK